METLTIPNLPIGTKRRLAILAKKQGFTKTDGKPNTSALIRDALQYLLDGQK